MNLDENLRAFGASPQVMQTVGLIRGFVGAGSGIANLVASATGDKGIILAVQWLDFFLGARPLPPEMPPEALEKLADACVATRWMEDTASDVGQKVAELASNLLYLIPGAGGVAKQATNLVLAIWSFARAFRNRMCGAREIRAILSRREDLTPQIIAAMPEALRRDWRTAVERRLRVESTLERDMARPATTATERAAVAAARADDAASSAALLQVEKLALRFHPAGLPAFSNAPATTVARRYIRRPANYVPPAAPPSRPDTNRSVAMLLYGVAGAGFLVYLLRARR